MPITWHSCSPIGRFNISVAGPGIWTWLGTYKTGNEEIGNEKRKQGNGNKEMAALCPRA